MRRRIHVCTYLDIAWYDRGRRRQGEVVQVRRLAAFES
jgi:hypothetical protein